MRYSWLALLAACGGGTSSAAQSIDVTTSFAVTTFSGNGPSPLDPLQGQTVDISIHWDGNPENWTNGDGNDPMGCRSLAIGWGPDVTVRTAHGATADLVQTQILDPLDNWYVALQLCDAAGQSTVGLDADIDALNLAYGCFGVPPTAMKKNAAGYPELTSFTATQCSSTILDVVNNRVIGGDNFTMTIKTDPAELP